MTTVQIDPEFQSLIAPLTGEERTQLEANLIADGCRDPLVTWRHTLLDGHNRFAICREKSIDFTTIEVDLAGRDDAKIWIIRNQFGRRNLQPYQRGELALVLKPLLSAKGAARQGARTDLLPKLTKSDAFNAREEIAKAAGLSNGTIAKVETIAAKAPEAVKEQLRRGEVSIDRAYQEIRGTERRAERVDRILETNAGNTPIDHESPVPVIYADPPWEYEHVKRDVDRIENHYPTMPLDAICRLNVAATATPDAILFLWSTSPKLAEAMQVVTAWGFTYRTSMVWIKDKIGMGYWARQQHEFLLIATRGEMPTPKPEHRPASVIVADRGAHSHKPERVYELIEQMYPEFQKRELFLRGAPRPGWLGWGNEADVRGAQ